jgi:hypothetical protein
MRFLFLLILLTGAATLHADSTDVYKVSFRGKQLGTFTERQIINIVLKADSLFSNDTLVVDVIRDRKLTDANVEYSMIIFGNAGPLLIDSTQRTESFKIPLKPLVEHKRKTGCTQFNGYYTQFLTAQRSRVIQFRIKLE